MSVRLIIDGNEVYEIDEDCECYKAAVEQQQAGQSKRCGQQRPNMQSSNQQSKNPNSQQGTQNWNNTRK